MNGIFVFKELLIESPLKSQAFYDDVIILCQPEL